MNNNSSPNSLGDFIRIENADLAPINVLEMDGAHYATESSIGFFMEENGIKDKDMLMEAVSKFNNVDGITLLDESTEDPSLIELREFMTIMESLDPFKLTKVAKGRTLLRTTAKQLGSFITGKEFDEEKDIKDYIERCDSMLNDIAKEKRKVAAGKRDDSIKFSGMYLFNIAKSLFIIFCVPLMLSNKKLKLPTALTKLFVKNGSKVVAAETIKRSATIKKAANIAFTGMTLVSDLPPDLKGLYLSFKDYNELLSEYENQIRSIRRDLVKQQGKIERKKENKGMVLVEDTTPKDAVSVHYQTPEDLEVKNDRTPDVVHDDGSVVNAPKQMEAPMPEIDVPTACPQDKIETPQEPVEPKLPSVEPQLDKPVSNPPAEFSPLDAINQAKQNPLNVPVAKYGNLYYVDHNDLRCYMDACGTTKYESALNKIISAHEDSNSDFCAETVRVVMSENDMSNLAPEIKSAMESSEVEFEVYPNK